MGDLCAWNGTISQSGVCVALPPAAEADGEAVGAADVAAKVAVEEGGGGGGGSARRCWWALRYCSGVWQLSTARPATSRLMRGMLALRKGRTYGRSGMSVTSCST